MKKTTYETPTAELIFVRFEENLLASYGEEGQAGKNARYNLYEEDF